MNSELTERLPALSVIIPAYNAEKYIQEAVDSVKKQSWNGDLEIIVIDDGSTDKTAEAAAFCGCKVVSTSNSGAACARNRGLSLCAGGLVFFLDADDLITDQAFSQLYSCLKGHPEIKAVFSKARDFISPELSKEEASKLIVRTDSYGGFLTGCSMIRKEVFDTVGLFNESLKSGETIAWMIELRDSGLKIIETDTVTLMRRLHMTNTGRTGRSQEMKNYAAILRARMKR